MTFCGTFTLSGLRELTTVVNNQLRKECWVPPPPLPLPDGELARRISGPRYNLEEVKRLATEANIKPMTRKVDDDMADLAWDIADVAAMFQALDEHDYHASEWVQVNNRMVVDADAYVIEYDEHCQRRRRLAQRYYVKFGFANNKFLLLLVSCHEERGNR